MELRVVGEEDFNPSTITIKAEFNNSIDIHNLTSFLPIRNIFDKKGYRELLLSGSRESIKYFGPEESIVSICYKKIRRGMRTGAMNNMVSVDMQLGGKNIHLKVSNNSLTSVGTSSVDFGIKVFETMVQKIKNIQDDLDRTNNCEDLNNYITIISEEIHKYSFIPGEKEVINIYEFIKEKYPEKDKNIFEFLISFILDFKDNNNFEKYIDIIKRKIKNYTYLPSKDFFIKDLIKNEKNIDTNLLNIILSDYEIEENKDILEERLNSLLSENNLEFRENYIKKISLLLEKNLIFKGKLESKNYDIFNSVYHIQPLKSKKKFRMPLHKLAPFFAKIGVSVDYHNWASEGVNICFEIENLKEGNNHEEKDYKHRFTIHETSKIRQCSPTDKKEAYKYYLGVMNLLKIFFEMDEIDFSKYYIK